MYPVAQFSASNEICAIAVGKTVGINTHCGFLYNSEAESPKRSFFLHLGNPLHLFNETEFDEAFPGYTSTQTKFIWAPFCDIPVQLLKLIRSKCITIAKKNSALPYGIFHDEETFFDGEGNLILGKDSHGLTCATFVKVLLKGSGVNVLDDSDWPEERESDVYWLGAMIKLYEKDLGRLHHYVKDLGSRIKKTKDSVEIAALKLERTKTLLKAATLNKTIREFNEGTKSVFKRYRPEEISACSFRSSGTFPIKFEYPAGSLTLGARVLGEELLKSLPS